MLRILIADDHEIVRKALRNVIEAQPGWIVCGEAADGQAALDIARRTGPTVAILDVGLPALNGVALTRRLKQERPNVNVLIFTMHDDEATVRDALAAGAEGYVLKTDSEKHLVAAISALSAGRSYFSPFITDQRTKAEHEEHGSRLENFTIRELEIGQLIAESNSNKQIARRLDISVKTVESHRFAAMKKAGAHSAAEFVRFAIRHNLIQP